MTPAKKKLTRPSGHPPPEHIRLPDGGEPVPLLSPAAEITDRFLERFPDELDRYDDPELVRAWCEHDTRHIIGWAAAEANGREPLAKQLDWLGLVLESRGYPAQRLADTLEIAAEVLTKRHETRAQPLADVLQAGARHVRATPTFLTQQATR